VLLILLNRNEGGLIKLHGEEVHSCTVSQNSYILVLQLQELLSLWSPKCGWLENINMGNREIGCGGMD
jgi:hypothetical protein